MVSSSHPEVRNPSANFIRSSVPLDNSALVINGVVEHRYEHTSSLETPPLFLSTLISNSVADQTPPASRAAGVRPERQNSNVTKASNAVGIIAAQRARTAKMESVFQWVLISGKSSI
jgi:hypothetical protein